MTNPAARFQAGQPDQASANDSKPRAVSAVDEHAFVEAREQLALALDQAAEGRSHADIAAARQRLRELAVRLRDAGYWRTDKQGLRATVSLLWQADRYVSEMALNPTKES